jgi:DNA-binding MarR family transcriptional regulator
MREEERQGRLDRLSQSMMRIGRMNMAAEGDCRHHPALVNHLALHYLEEQRRSVTEVAEHLRMTVPGATGLVDRLSLAGLVVRHRVEDDRRLVQVEITPVGRQELQAMRERRKERLASFFAPLTDEELETFLSLIEKL